MFLYMYMNNQINVRSLIGQSAIVDCAGKLMEKLRVFSSKLFTNSSLEPCGLLPKFS